MKIVMVRHGQTLSNVLNEEQGITLFTGALNNEYTDLTDKGIMQAKSLTNLDIIKEIETVYCSDLDRAIQTAKLAKPGYNLNIDKRLRERSLGVFEGHNQDILLENNEDRKYLDDENYKNFRNSFNQKAPNGESYTDVSNRAKDFLDSLDFSQNKTIGIFAHCHIIRCLFLNMLKIEPKEKILRLKIKNCEPYIVEGNSIDELKLISHNMDDMYYEN